VPDAVKPDFHGVTTHWNRGFIAFPAAPAYAIVMLMVSVWAESGFSSTWRLAATISWPASGP